MIAVAGDARMAVQLKINWWFCAALLLALLASLLVDQPFQQWSQQLAPELRRALGWLTAAGDSKYSLVPIALATAGLLLAQGHVAERRWRILLGMLAWTGLFLLLAIASSGLLVNLIKLLIGRARPNTLLDQDGPAFAPFAFDSDYASMPSGHANTLLVLATALGLLLPKASRLLLAFGVWLAMTRIVVNAHFLSDVIAGGGLGIMTTMAWRGAFARHRRLFAIGRDGAVHLRGRRLWRWAWRSLPLQLVPGALQRPARLVQAWLAGWLPAARRYVQQARDWPGVRDLQHRFTQLAAGTARGPDGQLAAAGHGTAYALTANPSMIVPADAATAGGSQGAAMDPPAGALSDGMAQRIAQGILGISFLFLALPWLDPWLSAQLFDSEAHRFIGAGSSVLIWLRDLLSGTVVIVALAHAGSMLYQLVRR